MEKQIISRRFQAVNIDKTASGTTTDQVDLDRSQDECIGVRSVEIDSSDVTDYNIGISAGGKRVIDPINAKAIQADRSTPMSERTLPIRVPTSERLEIQTDVNTAPTGTLKFQVILELVKYADC